MKDALQCELIDSQPNHLNHHLGNTRVVFVLPALFRRVFRKRIAERAARVGG